MKSILGIDIGGTNIRLGYVAPDYTLSAFKTVASCNIFSSDNAMVHLADIIKDHIKSHWQPTAACIGFPATVNKQKTHILSAPNLKGLNGESVKDTLQQALSLPIFIEKDVNLLLCNDMRVLNAYGGTVIGCYIGTGLGNAICIDGKIYSGANGVAGELGHIPLFRKGVCGCGNTGCAEIVASGNGLQRLRKEHFSSTEISEVFFAHRQSKQIENYIDILSQPIATEINILDPDTVILGGGVVNMKHFPQDLFIKKIKEHTRKPLPYDNIQILYSKSAQENGVLGAGVYVFNKINKGEVL